MTARITADEVRALLTGTTPGPWRSDAEDDWIVRPSAEDAESCDDVAECRLSSAANRGLMAAAPDLASSVIALEEERDEARRVTARSVTQYLADVRRVEAALVSARAEAAAWETCAAEELAILAGVRGMPPTDGATSTAADLRALLSQCRQDLVRLLGSERAEVERLRAIIEGRTTPPTRAEFDALIVAGGWWRCATASGARGLTMCDSWHDVDDVARESALDGVTFRWWAHDASGRPCAWPVVGGAR